MTVNILGTEYEIIEATAAEDVMLEKCDGYCDKTVKTIVISKKAKDCHAFLFESGLSENFTHPEYGHDETYVDWIASQFPKMCEVFKEVGCL